MLRGTVVCILLLVGCVSEKQSKGISAKELTLSFEDCRQEVNAEVLIKAFGQYTLERTSDLDGYCEYRLKYADGSTFYVSSNIYTGSELNYRNRFEIGITTYSTNRSENDTIEYSGIQTNKQFWLESIRGKYAVGYTNATDTLTFKKMLNSITID